MENKEMNRKIWIAPNATVTGNVTLQNHVSVWYGAVLRGDSGAITVGEGSNIQDNAILHEKTTVGNYCTIGHGAIVHGCTVGDNCIIGMGAIVLNGAVLGNNCLVGAGAVVTGKTNAPDGSMLLGSPAKVVKPLTPEQIAGNRESAEHYIHLAFGQGEK
ncbi:MAG: gamma carbonic anhydrase family protein [Ruminococcaceae bacterium]|nr:gamma carbonic anhydrase family protein [Oscillospiraceae bacterium]